jgi:hypothetical protein
VRSIRTKLTLLAFSSALAACGARSDVTCLTGRCEGRDGMDRGGYGGSGGIELPQGGSGGSVPAQPPPVAVEPRGPTNDPPPNVSFPSNQDVDSLCTRVTTVVGPIAIGSPAELGQLVGCHRVVGNLSLLGFATDDLLALDSLQEVTGTFEIRIRGSLDGLQALEHAGNLILDGADVRSLEPLHALVTLGDSAADSGRLVVKDNPSLINLLGLTGLVQLRSLEVIGNPAVSSLAGFSLPTTLDLLQLVRNPSLATISTLRSLTRVDLIDVTSNGSLQSLDGLQNLSGSPGIALRDDASLTDLSALAGLTSVSLLHLDSLPIANLDVLQSLQQADIVLIETNPNLLQVDGLRNVALNKLSVTANPSLVSLPAFPNTAAIDQVYVRANARLVTGPQFPNVTSAERVNILENPSLPRVDGFAAVRTTRNLQIANNQNLTQVSFGALETARAVRIVCNPALPEADLSFLLDLGSSVIIQGNLGSASSCSPELEQP